MNIIIAREIYDDAQLIKKMKAPKEIKVKILGALLSRFEGIWRVVGITEDALKKFESKGFKRESGMQINRSHLKDRSDTYPPLVTEDLSYEKWWDYLLKHNDCILTTSSENMSGIWSRKIEIDTNLGLFMSSGYAWKHRLKKEGAYLKVLYNKHIIGS